MNEFIVPVSSEQITNYISSTSDAPEYADEYSDAPEYAGARATVGGVELTVGGWGEYYVNSRAAAHEFGSQLADVYKGGRGRYIYPDDAVAAITELTWQHPGVLRVAAVRLADALAQLEDILCEPSDDGIWECGAASTLLRSQLSQHFTITVPPLTSADLRATAANSRLGADPAAMDDLAAAAAETAAAVGLAPTAYNCGACAEETGTKECHPATEAPQRPVRVSDEEAVLQLEKESVEQLNTLERCQAALAGRLDVTAAAVMKAAAQLRKRATGDK
jgi:hypothetical protein